MGIDRIVSSLGLKTTNYWVSLLRSLPPHEVGVIKVSAGLFRFRLLFQSFVEELAYLVREAGIMLPLVVEARKDTLDFYQKKLSLALQEKNIPTYNVPVNVVYLKPSLVEKRWTVETIFTAGIIEAILSHRLPILVAAGVFEKRVVPLGGIVLARELVYTLHAKKLILVGHTPICFKDGRCITEIWPEEIWREKIRRKEITPAMARRVRTAFDILSKLGPGHSVQITRPQLRKDGISTGLLEELLGNGSGTYIALPPQITVYPLEAVDRKWLFGMIDEAFQVYGRRLRSDYFESIVDKKPLVYLDSLQKGGAVVYLLEEAPYMCKLFTRQDYEGIGIGSTVIRTIYKHFGGLCWRTSKNNERTPAFYLRLVDEYKGEVVETEKFYIYFLGKICSKKEFLSSRINALPSSFED
ncbi:hypothetical protein [Thermospira aquatica]|uniref:N-acetyltransferase domain-containing protein n=1 Tax=Thermospira aquatica TaxID=2828656 RepID=A0AAX3BDN9_9SPIR|nr:hypothetical protein [Thermospira aquatica]URA10225.1 hypothetical protein KDW03_12230 [Thermospira aquatica]